MYKGLTVKVTGERDFGRTKRRRGSRARGGSLTCSRSEKERKRKGLDQRGPNVGKKKVGKTRSRLAQRGGQGWK